MTHFVSICLLARARVCVDTKASAWQMLLAMIMMLCFVDTACGSVADDANKYNVARLVFSSFFPRLHCNEIYFDEILALCCIILRLVVVVIAVESANFCGNMQ